MELFEIKNNLVTFSPVALTLKPFKALWDRDKSKLKDKAVAELAAVYFFADYKSDFGEMLDDKEKLSVIKSVIIGMPKDWEPDVKFFEAVEFYKERQRTTSTILLEDARIGVNKISNYIKTVDLNEVDPNSGKPLHDIKKIADTIGNLPKVLETLNSLENSVKKDIQQSESMRGGHKKAIFEDGL